MNKENSRKYSRVVKLVGILSGFVLVLGTSYAVFRVTTTGEKENVVSAGKLDVRVENEQSEITINNALPQTEEEGKKNTSYTFDVVNKGNINAMYDMYIELSEDTTLPDNTVRYYLTKVVDDKEVALDEKSSHYLSDGIDSVDKNKKIYKVDTNDLIKPNETVSYKLYLWIDYDATTEEAANKVFKGNIRVDASQVVYQEKTLLRKVDVSEGEKGTAYAYVYADGTLEIKGSGKIKSGISDMNIYNADEKKLIENYKLVLTEMGYDVSSIKTSEDFANFIDQESAKDSDFFNKLDLQAYILSYREVLKKHGYENTETIVDENSVMEYFTANGLMDADGNLTEKGETISNEIENLYNNKFSGSVSIKNIKLEGNITNIPKGLYTGNENITEITIPSTVTSIDTEAFYDCTNLQKITIPEGVTAIGERAFSGSALKSIVLPNSVETIAKQAFSNCRNLTSVEFGSGVKTIGSRVFSSCIELVSISLPNSVTTLGGFAFSGCSKLESVQLSNAITTISASLFRECTSLRTITLPNVKSIGSYAFYNCTSLSNIEMANTIESIASYAFSGCSSLESIVLSSSLTQIANYAFDRCTSLTNINLKDTSLTTLSGYIFDKCTALESLTIPESATKIENDLSRVPNLKELVILGNIGVINNNAFSKNTNVENITFSKKVTDLTIWENIFNKDFPNVKSINFDEENPNYTSIDGIVFSKDKTQLIRYPKAKESLKYSIPTTTTTLSNNAFYQVKNILEISLPSSITEIGTSSIFKCPNLSILNIDIPHVSISLGVNNNESLKKIILSKNVETFDISRSLLEQSNGISTIEVDEDNPVFTAEDGVLFNKDKTKLLWYPAEKETEEYTIPSTVLQVGDDSVNWDGIYNSKFTKLNIPASLQFFRSINYLHRSSNLKEIVVDSNNSAFSSQDGVLFNKEKTTLLSYPRKKENASYVIPSTVTTIERFSFGYNTNLTSVTIPTSVRRICMFAFEGTTSISSITIPSSVTRVEPSPFSTWKANQTINIDNTKAYVDSHWYSQWSLTDAKINYLKS